MFRYLLSVRRVQSELQHCWALQMQRKHLKSNKTEAVKWRLRNHMAFLVDNLQYYLQVQSHFTSVVSLFFVFYIYDHHFYNLFRTQVDVLESQFSQLLQQINSTRDFESIRLAHDHFLSNLLAQSFILLKPVSLTKKSFFYSSILLFINYSEAHYPCKEYKSRHDATSSE